MERSKGSVYRSLCESRWEPDGWSGNSGAYRAVFQYADPDLDGKVRINKNEVKLKDGVLVIRYTSSPAEELSVRSFPETGGAAGSGGGCGAEEEWHP